MSTEVKFGLIKNTILNKHNSERFGRVCYMHSEYLSAMKNYSVALKLTEDNTIRTGPDLAEQVARIYHIIGILHCNLGGNQQAKEYYERALSIQLKKLGPDHVDVACTYHNMGNLHRNLGDNQQAKKYFERALSIQLHKL